MNGYVNDRWGLHRAVQCTVPFVHFRSDGRRSDWLRMEQARGFLGPYAPEAGGVRQRILLALLNRLLWRQHVWNQQTQAMLRNSSARLMSAKPAQGKDLPRLLVVAPSDVSERWSGGSARVWGLCRHLAPHADVTLLSVMRGHRMWIRGTIPGDVDSLVCPLSDQIEQQTVARQKRYGPASCWLTMGDSSVPFPLFDNYLRQVASTVSAVLMIGPYLYDRVRAAVPSVPVLYDMHDINTEYVGNMAGSFRESAVEEVQRIEGRMVEDARLILCVSHQDERVIQNLYPAAGGKTCVAPNGVSVDEALCCYPSQSRALAADMGLERPVVLFLGTMLEANRKAARFIGEILAPAVPEALCVVMGSAGPPHFSRSEARRLPDNVVFTGPVSEEEKEAVFCLSQAAVAPMAVGTGSSLKIPDYIAHGKPVIATAIGLRGFESLSKYVRVAELDGFADATRACLRELATNAVALDAQAEAARGVVCRTLDWSAITQSFLPRLRSAIMSSGDRTSL